ncbi:MAG: hypothetical protein A3E78_12355 [Alphaproteobacteria bacterium RIFCSPHIGHO2_12_FULL_63_12]|nr:MAG: hypothetical protein A3E78_12355 [Alphaproteobacteria bacterium RIFCSPHIGHO2_12_FULL_63_12]
MNHKVPDKEYLKRAEHIADVQRDYLHKTNLSAIAAIYVLAIFFVNENDPGSILWIFCPVLLFCLGIGLVQISLISAKHRAMERANGNNNDFPCWKSSWPYDLGSLIFLVLGVLTAVIRFPK